MIESISSMYAMGVPDISLNNSLVDVEIMELNSRNVGNESSGKNYSNKHDVSILEIVERRKSPEMPSDALHADANASTTITTAKHTRKALDVETSSKGI